MLDEDRFSKLPLLLLLHFVDVVLMVDWSSSFLRVSLCGVLQHSSAGFEEFGLGVYLDRFLGSVGFACAMVSAWLGEFPPHEILREV